MKMILSGDRLGNLTLVSSKAGKTGEKNVKLTINIEGVVFTTEQPEAKAWDIMRRLSEAELLQDVDQ